MKCDRETSPRLMETPQQRLVHPSRLSSLGRSVCSQLLSQHVFPFLDVLSLCKCMLVSRMWVDAANYEFIWRSHCSRLWEGKIGMATTRCFGKIRLQDSYVEALRNKPELLAMIVRERGGEGVQDKYCSVNELIQLVKTTSPTSVLGYDVQFRSIWKASYVYSKIDAQRSYITEQELIAYDWLLFFSNGSNYRVNFLPNGQLRSTIPTTEPFVSNAIQCYQIKYSHSSGCFIQMGDFPLLTVSRNPMNWGWILQNDFLDMYSV